MKQVNMDSSTTPISMGRIVESLNGVVATFFDREVKDRFGNDVTRIEFQDGRHFRLVHLTPPDADMQRATLYSGIGKFVRLTAAFYVEDGEETLWVDFANFKVSWKNGVCDKVMGPNGYSEQILLQKLQNSVDIDAVILDVLYYIQYRRHHWQYK